MSLNKWTYRLGALFGVKNIGTLIRSYIKYYTITVLKQRIVYQINLLQLTYNTDNRHNLQT